MMKLIAVLALSAALVGCTTNERNAVIGAGAGAAIGLATTGTAQGTLAGAAVGAAAGALLGRVAGNTTQCYYADGNGGTYIAPC